MYKLASSLSASHGHRTASFTSSRPRHTAAKAASPFAGFTAGGSVHSVSPRHPGVAYWQPLPARGYIEVHASPWFTPSLPFSQGIQVIPPGCSVRTHMHTEQHEVITGLSGEGEAEVLTANFNGEATNASNQLIRLPLTAGCTLTLAPGSVHLFRNLSSTSSLTFQWTISPPGLEDFFARVGREKTEGEERMPEAFQRPEGGEVDQKSKMKA
jgi:hypothetical protein